MIIELLMGFVFCTVVLFHFPTSPFNLSGNTFNPLKKIQLKIEKQKSICLLVSLVIDNQSIT
ncbi:hypothetical protein HDF22_004459 [Mucilaginibacter lappiensis]|uniref:Uncharacterized protein n=1 Tax=Mucilaginibacter lappiensis TaxID=354630 RepID=A0A841JGN0_9SPHI|nr:hypothetical protein [Mucilaginibacter lappiensis]